MHRNQLDHSPPQTSLIQHKWLDTRKVGRDDEEINQTKLAVEAERKRNRKTRKCFARGGAEGQEQHQNTEISELTQPVVLDRNIEETSGDKYKIVSPRKKRVMDDGEDGVGVIKIPHKIARSSKMQMEEYSINSEQTVRELEAHIGEQDKVIADLRKKLKTIGEVCGYEPMTICMPTATTKNVINLHIN